MTNGTPRSWLLGAGADWRTAVGTGGPVSDGVSVSSTDGIALEQTRSGDPESPAGSGQTNVRVRIGQLSFEIDREAREVRVYTVRGRLRHRWTAQDEGGNPVAPTDPAAWDPADVAGDAGCSFVLDRRYQVIYCHVYGHEVLEELLRPSTTGTLWSRVAMDEDGSLVVFDASPNAKPLRFGRRGEPRGLAAGVAWPPPITPPEPTRPKAVPSRARYRPDGYWMSQPLDSAIYKCPWHRVEASLKELPPGTQVEFKTLSYENPSDAPAGPEDARWFPAYTVVAPMQPRPRAEAPKRKGATTTCAGLANPTPNVYEFLIRGGPGRFLSLLMKVRGDSFVTPVVGGLRVHYPRDSYLEYLPPLYSASEPMRTFLEALLSIFQTEWDGIDRAVEESDAYIDPDAVPEGTAMTYLASWIGLDLEGEWTGRQNRRLLQAVPKIYPRRGTKAALRDYLRAYLGNFSNVEPDALVSSGFPAIVEGFEERQYLLLSRAGGSTLGVAAPLWSDRVVGRLQLGGLSQVGQVNLVSTGDPERDLFHHFAHRFRVYVPAAWIRTAEQERMLRRAIDAEKPAHTAYELCLVEAGIRVGDQSTVGVDTILGEGPAWRLPGNPGEPPPSRPPRGRLGESAVLSRGSGVGPAILHADSRVGAWALDE